MDQDQKNIQDMDGKKYRTTSWTKMGADDNFAEKKIDTALMNYGMSIVPQDIIPFFVHEELEMGDQIKLTLEYGSFTYEGSIQKIRPGGQMRMRYETALKKQLEANPIYGLGSKIQFWRLDENEYRIYVVQEDEEIILEDEMDLNELRYDGESPIFESVSVTKKDFSIYELSRRYDKQKLILEVGFQRRDVWKQKQKCELVESVLMGLPLPVIYLKQQENSNYVVVDGKQRLSALFSYMRGEFALKDLKILRFLNGKKFDELTGILSIYQSQLEDYQIYSHVILAPTPDEILFDIFDRVNRGGTQLNKMEIRNAIYNGRGLDMLISIAKTGEFEKATRILSERDIRMKGLYLLTRSAAFNLHYTGRLTGKDGYQFKGDMDKLQGRALRYLNAFSESSLSAYKEETVKDLQRIYEVLGPNAFRKEFDESKPINMNMFETLMYFMMKVRKREFLFTGEELKKKILDKLKEEEYAQNIGARKDSLEKINARFAVMDDLIEEVCR
ncbi:MAG: DUF262 domain-containing protein [Clostridium sp.]